MRKVDLTRPPDFIDALGRPTYRDQQARGLWEHMSDQLLQRPRIAGYMAAADRTIFSAVAAELRRLGQRGPLDILEIGGGTGHFFDMVRDMARSYTNIEPGDPPADAGMSERLRDSRYAVIRCTAEALPLRSDTADAALLIASLDHVPNHRAALSEIRRCLRPGATVVVVLNNAGSWWKTVLRGTPTLSARERSISSDHYFQWSAHRSAAEISKQFTGVRTRTVRYMPHVPVIWRALVPLADAAGHRWAPLKGGDTIVMARKPLESRTGTAPG